MTNKQIVFKKGWRYKINKGAHVDNIFTYSSTDDDSIFHWLHRGGETVPFREKELGFYDTGETGDPMPSEYSGVLSHSFIVHKGAETIANMKKVDIWHREDNDEDTFTFADKMIDMIDTALNGVEKPKAGNEWRPKEVFGFTPTVMQKKTITIDGKDIQISEESFNELKKQLCDN